MKPPVTIETARLRLRTPAMDDAEAIYTTYAQDPEVWFLHPNVSAAPRDCWCYARVKEAP